MRIWFMRSIDSSTGIEPLAFSRHSGIIWKRNSLAADAACLEVRLLTNDGKSPADEEAQNGDGNTPHGTGSRIRKHARQQFYREIPNTARA
jgi:hypothetical protein